VIGQSGKRRVAAAPALQGRQGRMPAGRDETPRQRDETRVLALPQPGTSAKLLATAN